MFKLLLEPLDKRQEERAGAANFLVEWQTVAHTGCLELGSGLHCVLSMAALHLKLDAGSLESLNSMIKASMASGNNSNMSLQLLSARVNSRKTVSMLAGGKTRLKDVRPVAEQLAKSSILFQSREEDVLIADMRYTPLEPKNVLPANNPALHNPSLVLSAAEKWAVKANGELLKAARNFQQSADGCHILGMMLSGTASACTGVRMLAEICARSCWTLSLQLAVAPQTQQRTCFASSLLFTSSLTVLASQQTKVQQGSRVTVSLCKLVRRSPADNRRLLEFLVDETWSVTTLRPKLPKKKDSKQEKNKQKDLLALPDGRPDDASEDGSEGSDVEREAEHVLKFPANSLRVDC